MMGGGFHQHRDTVRSAVLVDTWIRSGMSFFRWQSVDAVRHGFQEAGIHVGCAKIGIPEPQRAIPKTLILFGGARFIIWRLRRLF